MNDGRSEHLAKYLVKELGSRDNVKEFSSSLRILSILDLKDEDDLMAVTEHGLIDTLVVLYKFGTLGKLVEVKSKIKQQKELKNG